MVAGLLSSGSAARAADSPGTAGSSDQPDAPVVEPPVEAPAPPASEQGVESPPLPGAEPPVTESPLGDQPHATLGGYVRGDLYVGEAVNERQAELKAAYAELALVARTAKSPLGDGYAEGRLRYGLQGNLQETFLDLREAYVNTYFGPVDLRLGKQIIVWGRADLLNPTNNLTPIDLRIRSPIEDDRRIGNIGARAFVRLAPAPLRLEVVWLPFFVPSELPAVALPQYVAFGPPKYPSPMVANGTEAGRLHLELASFELSVSYLYGYAPLPGLTLGQIIFDKDNPAVLIARTAYRQQVVGFDFSTAVGDVLGIRGEAAYRRPFDYANQPSVARPDLQYAVGLDHQFGSIMVIAQYLGRYCFEWTKQTGPAMELDPDTLKIDPNTASQADLDGYTRQYGAVINSILARYSQIIFSQTERVQNLATARLEWTTLHDSLSLSATGIVNVTTREWLAAPKVAYRISDALTAYVGAEVLSGPPGTLFGLIDRTLSAGYVELRSTF
jgi:hypothetical protein